jgi:hypothetical protein
MGPLLIRFVKVSREEFFTKSAEKDSDILRVLLMQSYAVESVHSWFSF